MSNVICEVEWIYALDTTINYINAWTESCKFLDKCGTLNLLWDTSSTFSQLDQTAFPVTVN